MSDANQHTVCIIGGGMSGLITGALLAKNGYKVTVLEKNHIIGGGLQSFVRYGCKFNTGMQGFAGCDDAFALGHVFKYVGIDGRTVGFTAVDSSAQEIVWTNHDHCYHLPKGRKTYEKYLISQFPKEKTGIKKIVSSIYEIGNTFDYFWLHPIQEHPELIQYAKISARQLLQQYTSNIELQRLFEYVGPHLGYNLSKLPSVELGMIGTLYIEGGWRISGGSNKLAQALVKSIEDNNGRVYGDTQVTKVHIENERMVGLTTANDECCNADTYICAISPKLLTGMTDNRVFRASTKERISSFINDSSCCNIYIKLKDKSYKFYNSFVFLPHPNPDDSLPKMIGVITPPCENQGKWAKTMEIFLPSHYHDFNKWEKTYTGKRGKEYEDYKMEIANKIIEYVASYYPELKQAVDKVFVSTPLTIRDYYGNPHGASYSQQGAFIPIRTRVSNLYMTGQAIQYQGLYGVLTSAIMTAETILGRSLIEEIAKA